jgi:hypothetical protein
MLNMRHRALRCRKLLRQLDLRQPDVLAQRAKRRRMGVYCRCRGRRFAWTLRASLPSRACHPIIVPLSRLAGKAFTKLGATV